MSLIPSRKDLAQESVGIKNQAWKPADSNNRASTRQLLTSDWLVNQPDLPALVQVIPAQKLATMIAEEGLEECVEVVEWIRNEQLVAVFDHDVWLPANADTMQRSLSADRFMNWLRVWNEISPEFAAKRFLELEEEVMVLLANEMFEIIPVGLENGRSPKDDRYLETIDKKFFIRVNSESPDAEDLFLQFAKTIYGVDMALATRVFSYSAMLVQAESQLDAEKWREGRLADDGFVERIEAFDILKPTGLKRWNKTNQAAYKEAESMVKYPSHLADPGRKSDSIGHMLKLMLSYSDEEQSNEVRRLLEPSQLEQIVGVENPPDSVIESEKETLVAAAEVAVNQALSKVQMLDVAAMKTTAQSDSDKLLLDVVIEELAKQQPEKAIQFRERLARQANAVASLSEEPTSADVQRRSLEVLHSGLNLGLEFLLSEASTTEELAQFVASKGVVAFETQKAVDCLVEFGIENTFRAGFDLMHEIAAAAVVGLEDILKSDTRAEVRMLTTRKMGQTQDGVELTATLSQMLSANRYADLRGQLWLMEEHLSAEVSLLSRSFINRFPALPLALLNQETMKLGAESKVIDGLSDWAVAFNAASKLSSFGTVSTASGNQNQAKRGDYAETEIH